MRIAGQRRGETYPDAARAAASLAALFVRIGFDNSTELVEYSNLVLTEPLLRAAAGPALSVPLTGFTPGNLILIGISISAQANASSGVPVSRAQINPLVDVGAGPRLVVLSGQPRLVSGTPSGECPAFTYITAVKPLAVEVVSDPVITCQISVEGPDPIDAYDGVFIWAAELDATTSGLITQFPTTTLA